MTVSIALACRTFQISETCYRYERKLSDGNAEIADWLVRLTTNRRTWGFGLCFLYLRNVKGYGWNHKLGSTGFTASWELSSGFFLPGLSVGLEKKLSKT